MPASDVALLITAVTGVIGAVGLIVTPIVVAVINVRAKRKGERVEQGQPVDHLGTLIADLTGARDYWRRRADEHMAERDEWRRRAERAEAQILED